jgi:uncharacterized membrane protein
VPKSVVEQRAGDEGYHPQVIVLVAALAGGWVLLLLAAPVLPAWAGAIVYGFGSLICHQIPERSFHLADFQLPVCARCFGIYIGASAGAAHAWMRTTTSHRTVSRAPWVSWRLAILAACPTLLTVALETAGAWYPSNLTRALAGAPLGVLAGLVVVGALATLHYDECAPPRPTAPKPPQRLI